DAAARGPGPPPPASALPEPAHAGMPELTDAARSLRTADRGGQLVEWLDLARDHDHPLALALELAIDDEQGMPADDAAQPLPGRRPECDVDHPGLILQRQEDAALG